MRATGRRRPPDRGVNELFEVSVTCGCTRMLARHDCGRYTQPTVGRCTLCPKHGFVHVARLRTPVASLHRGGIIAVQRRENTCVLRPLNRRAQRWLQQRVQEGAQWFAGALVVEPRCLMEVMDDALYAGIKLHRA